MYGQKSTELMIGTPLSYLQMLWINTYNTQCRSCLPGLMVLQPKYIQTLQEGNDQEKAQLKRNSHSKSEVRRLIKISSIILRKCI